MLNLIKLDFKNNKLIFLIIITFILLFSFLLFANLYNIEIYNFHQNETKLTVNHTNIIKWIEIFYPCIFSVLVAKIFSDAFSSSSMEFTLTIPIKIYKQIFYRLFFWMIIYFILTFLSISIFQNKIIGEIGSNYLPVTGLHIYTLINIFVLSSYVIFIQFIFREFYFSIGFLISYILLDYFAEGRFLGDLTLHSYAFRNYQNNYFVIQKILIIALATLLLLISYILVSKSKTYRKLIK